MMKTIVWELIMQVISWRLDLMQQFIISISNNIFWYFNFLKKARLHNGWNLLIIRTKMNGLSVNNASNLLEIMSIFVSNNIFFNLDFCEGKITDQYCLKEPDKIFINMESMTTKISSVKGSVWNSLKLTQITICLKKARLHKGWNLKT